MNEMTEVWVNDEDPETDSYSEANNADRSVQEDQGVRLVKAYIMFLFSWQSLFRVSNTAMAVLFSFFAVVLHLVLKLTLSKKLKSFAESLPRSIAAAKKLIGCSTDFFIKYASCPACDSIYPIEMCKVVLHDKSVRSLRCSYVRFPNHPQARMRAPCNTDLMKTVKTSHGTTSLYPRRLFCYQSLIGLMRNFIKRPGFVEKCELWRTLKSDDDILKDIYDGKVWRKFPGTSGHSFLALPYNYVLSFNVDWFQPFKHSTYSAGAMYMAILNLPRKERYKTENILLIGVIPGPREPKKTMNTYLEPLVNEKELWQGVVMQHSSGAPAFVRAALICTSCDIPASRKVSGFVGHKTHFACSRCLKEFPYLKDFNKPDYTGTDREHWPVHTMKDHIACAREHKLATTHEEQRAVESKYGCRYSVLLELPYYNVIKYCVVDPMHNILLGTAKHVMVVWTSIGLITKSHLPRI